MEFREKNNTKFPASSSKSKQLAAATKHRLYEALCGNTERNYREELLYSNISMPLRQLQLDEYIPLACLLGHGVLLSKNSTSNSMFVR